MDSVELDRAVAVDDVFEQAAAIDLRRTASDRRQVRPVRSLFADWKVGALTQRNRWRNGP